MRVIDELADCGVYCMSITGGEPLVRADFWELVDHMLERGMRIMVIYSNGALVDDGASWRSWALCSQTRTQCSFLRQVRVFIPF